MIVERFNLKNAVDFEKYYPIISSWYEHKSWNTPHLDCFSTNGMIVKDGDEYICAGWLFCTDSSLGVMGWFITNNQKNAGFIKRKTLKYLITNLEELAKNLGIKLIYIPMETRSIGNLLNTYKKTSENISEFFKSI